MKLKVQAQHLQPGDIVGSGERVYCTSSGITTPKGKIEVYLAKPQSANNYDTMRYWGKYTMINVERKECKIS